MRYDIIAIIASPRGMSQMRQLVKGLPASFPAPVVCLAQCHSAFSAQLAAESALPVRWVEAGERMQPAHVYISPPRRTPLLVDDGSISLAPYGPESTALQPQDRFLTSIARKYGSRALCIVLGNVVHRGFGKPVLDRFCTISAREETACARALRFRHRVVIDDIEADPQYLPYLEAARAAGYRAVQSTPLFSAYARIAGMLSTHYPYPHPVGTDEARMLDQIAREAQPLVTRFQGERGEQ